MTKYFYWRFGLPITEDLRVVSPHKSFPAPHVLPMSTMDLYFINWLVLYNDMYFHHVEVSLNLSLQTPHQLNIGRKGGVSSSF